MAVEISHVTVKDKRSDVAAPVENTKESTAFVEFSAGCQITKQGCGLLRCTTSAA
jgi:hypothetical protein